MPQNDPEVAGEEQLDARLVELLHQMREQHLDLHDATQTAAS